MCHQGRSAPNGHRPSVVKTSSCSPAADPVLPSLEIRAETPATTTRLATATHPRWWMSIPITRPATPPNTPAVTICLTCTTYGPPVSMTVPVSPPIADTRPMSRRPAAIPTDSGTHMASAARSIAPHGTGVGLGRTAWVSQSGIRSALVMGISLMTVRLMSVVGMLGSAISFRSLSLREPQGHSGVGEAALAYLDQVRLVGSAQPTRAKSSAGLGEPGVTTIGEVSERRAHAAVRDGQLNPRVRPRIGVCRIDVRRGVRGPNRARRCRWRRTGPTCSGSCRRRRR